MTILEEQLLKMQETLAGFHSEHPIRSSLIIQIEDLKQQIQQETAELANPLSYEEQITSLEKTLAGFHPEHYIRGSIEEQIKQLEDKIKKNYLWN
tara:strand:- start:829 stop:1113 length:285 start_codon:yes stop_codon:yes gene_type:complete